MDRSLQRSLAQRLLALHDVRRPLVLVNAWDVASALVVQRAGLPAIATSSSAVSSALGYPDGERIPAAEMLALVARIVDQDRKSTRLNSSHTVISYAVFCLKKKNNK